MKQNCTPEQLPVPNTVRHYETTGDEQIKVITLEDDTRESWTRIGGHLNIGTQMCYKVNRGENYE